MLREGAAAAEAAAALRARVEAILADSHARVLALLQPAPGRGAGGGGPQFALWPDYGAWELIYAGRRASVGDEVGLRYLEVLLKVRPGELVHASELFAAGRGGPVLQEASLAEQHQATVRAIERQARECQEVLENPTTAESEKRQALTDLEQLRQARAVAARPARSGASQCAEAVRKALRRLHDGFAQARGRDRRPHPVLRDFAAHLKEHLLDPSARYAGRRGGPRRAGVAGCFIYERPAGIFWES